MLNGIYRFKKGDATVTQLVQQEGVNSLIVDDGRSGFPVAKVQGGFAGFAGQDATLLYTYNNWSSAGSAYKIVK